MNKHTLLAKMKEEVNKCQARGIDIAFEIINRSESSTITDEDSNNNSNSNMVVVQLIKKTKLVGFRDRILLQLIPKNGEDVIVEVYSRSIDQNFFTALCKCEPQTAYYFCCCGLFPTLDYGENKRFVLEFLNGLDLPYIYLEDDEINQVKNDAYKPPTPPLIRRDSFGWNDNDEKTAELNTNVLDVAKKRNAINSRSNTLSSQVSGESDGKASPSRGYIKISKPESPLLASNEQSNSDNDMHNPNSSSFEETNGDEHAHNDNEDGNSSWFEI